MSKEQFTDAIMLLRSDHEEVKGLFGKFENASGADRKRKIAEKICDELKIHSMIEEEIFYPEFARATGDEQMLEHARIGLVLDLGGGQADGRVVLERVPAAPQIIATAEAVAARILSMVSSEASPTSCSALHRFRSWSTAPPVKVTSPNSAAERP